MGKSNFQHRLKEGLKLRKMKPVDLANKLNINRAIISQYLNGRYMPNHNRIYDIAEALNVNEAWLMGFDVEMEIEKNTDIISPKVFLNEVIILLNKTTNMTDKEKNKIINEIKYICEDD